MKTTFEVKGMTCEHCVAHVKEALEAVAGVTKAKVSLKKMNAIVEHDERASPVALKAAVTEAGYTAA
jgi:copper ion binding protein